MTIITPVFAETGPKNGDTWQPHLPGPAPAVPNPMVVSDVVVDKEAENAVVAREKAMAESRRAAFMKLAERNMTPAEFKAFKPPKDSDIAMLVQDFEVQDEQMSATRYVGTFTVRFRDNVRNYIDVHTDPGPPPETYVDAKPETAEAVTEEDIAEPEDGVAEVTDNNVPREPPPGAVTETRRSWLEGAYGMKARPGLVYGNGEPAMDNDPIAQNVLILPYFEKVSGQTLLWEEQNPWLPLWQGALPRTPANGRKFYVPLGDISDIAAGSSAAVWSGNYAAVDKLLGNYGAEQAVLAVANRSGPELTVEIYSYRDGKLRRRNTLKPYVEGMAATEAFRKGINETIAYLQAPAPEYRTTARKPVEQISRDLLANRNSYDTVVVDSNSGGSNSFEPSRPLVMKPLGQDYRPYDPAVAAQPVSAGVPGGGVIAGTTRLQATMQFNDSRSWMDLQRRVSAVMPPVRMDISSMSSNSVSFTLTSDAPAGVVKQSLYSRGIELHPPAMEYGAGGAPVYDVRLAPAVR